ncbi:MAG: hypothetical protein RSD46_05280, partial [Oscillospiraceae bacterium]
MVKELEMRCLLDRLYFPLEDNEIAYMGRNNLLLGKMCDRLRVVKNISESFGDFCPFSIVGQEVGGQWFSRQSEENGRPLGRVGNVRGWGSKTEEPPLSAIL